MRFRENVQGRQKRHSSYGVEYTSRDLVILKWIGKQYAVRFDQARRMLTRHGPHGQAGPLLSITRARAILQKYYRAGLIEIEKVFHSDPAWIWLTVEGLRAVDLPYNYLRPGPGQLRHLYFINQAQLLLEEWYPAGHWMSERALRSEQERRSFGKKVGHVPDALFFLDDVRIAIEIELVVKEHRRLSQILRSLFLRYDRCFYFCSSPVRSALENAYEQIRQIDDRPDFLELFDSDIYLA